MRKKNTIIPYKIELLLKKTSLYKKRLISKRLIINYTEVDLILNEAPPLLFEDKLSKLPKIAIIKTSSNELIEGYVNPKASWLRYERFCKNNNIPYSIYDITKSDWILEAKKYDIFICHTAATPAYQKMIESKIYVLEKIMGKFCFPSFHEVWQYEDKNIANYLYQYYNLPSIPTYVTYNKNEAINIITRINYPFISKTSIGAGSSGVEKINSRKKALDRINKIFSKRGLKTQYPYQRQKDYFYVQDFIEDATYDLRVMLVGNKAFGYYRYPNKGDFRASGANNVEKKAIPHEALMLAIDIRNKLNSRQLGVDLLFSEKSNKYYIIETSLFNQIDTPEQLVIDGVAGYYDIADVNNITFKEGKFWIQELVLRDVVTEWASNIH